MRQAFLVRKTRGECDQLTPTWPAHLGDQAGYVGLDGLGRDEQPVGDLSV